MERIPSYVEGRHFRIGDLYAFGISVGIEFAADRKSFFRRGGGDQCDYDDARSCSIWKCLADNARPE